MNEVANEAIGTIELNRDAVRVHKEFGFNFFKTYAVRMAETIEIERILVEMGKSVARSRGLVAEAPPQVREDEYSSNEKRSDDAQFRSSCNGIVLIGE